MTLAGLETHTTEIVVAVALAIVVAIVLYLLARGEP